MFERTFSKYLYIKSSNERNLSRKFLFAQRAMSRKPTTLGCTSFSHFLNKSPCFVDYKRDDISEFLVNIFFSFVKVQSQTKKWQWLATPGSRYFTIVVLASVVNDAAMVSPGLDAQTSLNLEPSKILDLQTKQAKNTKKTDRSRKSEVCFSFA